MEGNPISDVSPLAGLVQLRVLNMAGLSDFRYSSAGKFDALGEPSPPPCNQIEDLIPLANLTRLRDLWLVDNQITDVHPLEKLTLLEELRIQRQSDYGL